MVVANRFGTLVPLYQYRSAWQVVAAAAAQRRWYIRRMPPIEERVQTGVRLEKRILKVLRALADYLDISLGDLIEGIVLHAFDGKAPFSRETLAQIEKLKGVYGLTLDAVDSHQLTEITQRTRPRRTARAKKVARKKVR